MSDHEEISTAVRRMFETGTADSRSVALIAQAALRWAEMLKRREKPPEPFERAEAINRRIGELLANRMPDGWGFVFLMGSFGGGPDARMTYCSNIERESAVAMAREWLSKVEGGEPEI